MLTNLQNYLFLMCHKYINSTISFQVHKTSRTTETFHKQCIKRIKEKQQSQYKTDSVKVTRQWWPAMRCDILSCIKLRNGANPVPGPTMITGMSKDCGNSIVPRSTHTDTFDSAPTSDTNYILDTLHSLHLLAWIRCRRKIFLLLVRYVPNVAKKSIWDQCNIENQTTTDDQPTDDRPLFQEELSWKNFKRPYLHNGAR